MLIWLGDKCFIEIQYVPKSKQGCVRGNPREVYYLFMYTKNIAEHSNW